MNQHQLRHVNIVFVEFYPYYGYCKWTVNGYVVRPNMSAHSPASTQDLSLVTQALSESGGDVDSAAAYIFQMMALTDDASSITTAARTVPPTADMSAQLSSLSLSVSGLETRSEKPDSLSTEPTLHVHSKVAAIAPSSDRPAEESTSSSSHKKVDSSSSTHKQHEPASSKHTKPDAHLSNRQRQELKKRAKKEAKAEERHAPLPAADPLPVDDKLGSMAI